LARKREIQRTPLPRPLPDKPRQLDFTRISVLVLTVVKSRRIWVGPVLQCSRSYRRQIDPSSTHTRAHTHTRARAHTQAHTHARTHAHIQSRTHAHINTHARARGKHTTSLARTPHRIAPHAHTYTNMYMHTYTHTYTRIPRTTRHAHDTRRRTRKSTRPQKRPRARGSTQISVLLSFAVRGISGEPVGACPQASSVHLECTVHPSLPIVPCRVGPRMLATSTSRVCATALTRALLA
jgi:hypothetical protein